MPAVLAAAWVYGFAGWASSMLLKWQHAADRDVQVAGKDVMTSEEREMQF